MGFLRILSSIFNYRNIQVEEIKNYTMVIMDPESIDIEKGLHNQWFLKTTSYKFFVWKMTK